MLFLKHIAQMIGCRYKFIVTGYSLSTIKKNILDDIEDVFGFDTHLDSNGAFRLFGNTVLCFGTNDSDAYKAIRGFTAHGMYGNEVTLSHKDALDEAMKRCSGKGSRLFWETNPDNPLHHVKANFIDRADGKQIAAHHFKLTDNNKLPPEYIKNIMEVTPRGVRYDRDINGLWVAAEGIIYDMMQATPYPQGNIIDDATLSGKFRPVAVGVDYGTTNPCVFLLSGVADLDGKERTVIRNEYFWDSAKQEKTKTDAEYLADMDRFFADNLLNRHDTEIIVDPSARSFIVSLESVGYKVRPAENAVNEGIRAVSNALYNRTLLIHRDCSNTLREFTQYRWDHSQSIRGKDQPVKADDHAMDAIRYIVFTHNQDAAMYLQPGTFF